MNLLMLLNIVNYFISDLDDFHFVGVPSPSQQLTPVLLLSLVDGECRFLVVQALKMHRKKARTFMFTLSVLVVVISIVTFLNTASAELNGPSSTGKLVTCMLILNIIACHAMFET